MFHEKCSDVCCTYVSCFTPGYTLRCKRAQWKMKLSLQGSLFVAPTVSTKFHCCRCAPTGADRAGKWLSKDDKFRNWKTFTAWLITEVYGVLTPCGLFLDILRSLCRDTNNNKTLKGFWSQADYHSCLHSLSFLWLHKSIVSIISMINYWWKET